MVLVVTAENGLGVASGQKWESDQGFQNGQRHGA